MKTKLELYLAVHAAALDALDPQLSVAAVEGRFDALIKPLGLPTDEHQPKAFR